VGLTVSRTVFDRLRELTERALTELKPLIEARAERGVPRDGHGDLRLDHVYRFPDRAPPEDLVVVDAIEFDTRLRAGDPVSDMAFLAMDLRCCGRPDLARAYCDAYFEASGDHEARALLPFYIGYRAAVRGKVEGIRANEPEVPEPERVAARMRARAYWVLALGALETPSRRPCLALVGGLPGTGKSTLSRNLSASAGFAIVRSDVVRKELAGSTSSTRAAFETGIYTAEWTDRTYAECLRRAEELLFEGGRVVIDATFRRERDRRAFLDAAQRWAVPAVFFVCQANSSIVRTRLENRHGDVSDADWSLSSSLAEHWEEPGTIVQSSTTLIETSVGRSAALAQALAALRLLDLAEAPVGVD
jgi:predicted kinase